MPYDTKLLAQDIAGGIGETGCMPSYKDLCNSDYGYLIQKYLKSKSNAEVRMKLARLLEWFAVGAGIPGCMHGGGSPDVAKLMIRHFSDLEKKVELVKKLIDID
jgi:4-hydroxybutyryl-CoA dehydratase/vinylacetyl-CoA-Delta-isomerase